jgi:hypothetical protein
MWRSARNIDDSAKKTIFGFWLSQSRKNYQSDVMQQTRSSAFNGTLCENFNSPLID